MSTNSITTFINIATSITILYNGFSLFQVIFFYASHLGIKPLQPLIKLSFRQLFIKFTISLCGLLFCSCLNVETSPFRISVTSHKMLSLRQRSRAGNCSCYFRFSYLYQCDFIDLVYLFSYSPGYAEVPEGVSGLRLQITHLYTYK